MSSSESNESFPRSPFPKKIEEQPTRHPTTIKKQGNRSSTSFRRTNQDEPYYKSSHSRNSARINKSQHLKQSLIILQDQKENYKQKGRLREVMNLQDQIRRTKSVLNRVEMKQLQLTHRKEKKSIKEAYDQEMLFFESAWYNYFRKYKDQERRKVKEFQLQQDKEVEFAREKLRRKCGSLRHPRREVMDLEREEQYLMKMGKYKEVELVRQEKKKLVKKFREQRTETISKWTILEGTKLEEAQLKRFTNLINRLKEHKKDQENEFFTQKKKLKQKYKNILGQLRHHQVMTTYYITRRQTEY